jgi:DNA repair protein RadC
MTRDPEAQRKAEDRMIQRALSVVRDRLRTVTASEPFTMPQHVKDYARLKLANKEHEEFHVLYLDVKNRLIAAEMAFTGTLHQTSIYPREVVKGALHHNAHAVIFLHNHPSGEPEPSEADKLITERLKQALLLVDVRVLDHIIVAGMRTMSFAEHGLL